MRDLMGSKAESPVPMNCWSRKTVLMAGKSSRDAFNFTTRPKAPTLIASCKISGPWYEVKNRILETGAILRICPSGFHTVEIWKPDVQQNQVGLQFFTLLNRL